MLNKFVGTIALIGLFNFTVPEVSAAVTVGPYLQNATQSSMTIHWNSSSTGVGRVVYGTNQNNLNLSADEATSGKNHIVSISGLKPNTKYFYKVGNGTTQEEPANAAEQYFFTNPNTATATRIWVLGDSGTGTRNQAAVRDAYYSFTANTRTNVVLALGDNAYNNGSEREYSRNFFSVYQDLFVNTPVWSTQGNHERNQRVYENVFSHPTKGEGGGVASGSELYYSFNYGDIHFICLDSYSSAININTGAPQYLWLEQDLQANTKPWVVAFWHHPSYSKTSGHNSDTETGMKKLRENANLLLEEYGVDIVFGGHNHSYSRSFFINGHYGVESTFNASIHKVQNGDGRTVPYNKTDSRGTVYVMSGSAGKTGYSLDSHDANVARFFNLGSFVIDVTGSTLTGTYLRENGNVDDVFTIKKASVVNQAPTVDAGVDSAVQTPNAITLNGKVTDDGFVGTTLTINWSQVSGPGTATFANTASETTTATFSANGTYVLRLSANDGEFNVTDDVTIIASSTAPKNQPPVANAGADSSVQIPNAATLMGLVTDDSFKGTTLTVSWIQVSGPGTATFANANVAATTATFTTEGSYVLQLIANDGEFRSTDNVTITVLAEAKNQAPVVNAGADVSVQLPDSATLYGTVTDDSFKGTTLTIAWSQVSGPGTATFANVNAAETTATFSTNGTYTLRLTANDGEFNVTDDVIITTSPAPVNQAPVANAGANQSIILPASATLVGRCTDDGLPKGSNVTARWSGNSAIFSNPNATTTSVSFSAEGNYTVVLTCNDTLLSHSSSAMITVTTAPTNMPPVVNAGIDTSVQMPNALTLNGTVIDDGFQGTRLTNTWSKLSGPGTVTFSAANTLNSTAVFSTHGTYVLRLTANDTQFTVTDDVTVTVVNSTAQNQAPVANAGAEQSIRLPALATLNGSCTDDGLPIGATVTARWSSSTDVTFSSSNLANTTARFASAGRYTLRLTCSDSLLTHTAATVVYVAAEPVNLAPVVEAGKNEEATEGKAIKLHGSVVDDNLPLGAKVTTTWSTVSGPGKVTFANINDLTSKVSFNREGIYVLKLTASDSQLSASDTVTIVVEESSGGGGFGMLFLVLIPLAFFKRLFSN